MKSVRVLLVDDEPLVRRSMEKSMLRAGLDVETADNVTEGLALFKQAADGGTPFDVAVLDLNMPDFEGRDNPDAGLLLLEELLKIRADLPVIVLTAFDEVTRAKEAVARGARAYLVKGREAQLLELIQDVLEE